MVIRDTEPFITIHLLSSYDSEAFERGGKVASNTYACNNEIKQWLAIARTDLNDSYYTILYQLITRSHPKGI